MIQKVGKGVAENW